MAVLVSSSSSVVVVDIFSFLGSGSDCSVSSLCVGGGYLSDFESGLFIFSGLCEALACTRWSPCPLQF